MGGENWRFYLWFSVLYIAASLIAIGLVYQTINAHEIGMLA